MNQSQAPPRRSSTAHACSVLATMVGPRYVRRMTWTLPARRKTVELATRRASSRRSSTGASRSRCTTYWFRGWYTACSARHSRSRSPFEPETRYAWLLLVAAGPFGRRGGRRRRTTRRRTMTRSSWRGRRRRTAGRRARPRMTPTCSRPARRRCSAAASATTTSNARHHHRLPRRRGETAPWSASRARRRGRRCRAWCSIWTDGRYRVCMAHAAMALWTGWRRGENDSFFL
jgi:hypothetical protein